MDFQAGLHVALVSHGEGTPVKFSPVLHLGVSFLERSLLGYGEEKSKGHHHQFPTSSRFGSDGQKERGSFCHKPSSLAWALPSFFVFLNVFFVRSQGGQFWAIWGDPSLHSNMASCIKLNPQRNSGGWGLCAHQTVSLLQEIMTQQFTRVELEHSQTNQVLSEDVGCPFANP